MIYALPCTVFVVLIRADIKPGALMLSPWPLVVLVSGPGPQGKATAAPAQ